MKRAGSRIVVIAIFTALLTTGTVAAGGSAMQFSNNGTFVTISGTTNLAPGDRLLVEVVSAGFTPTVKGNGTAFSGASGTVVVRPGDPLNTYRFDLDVSAFSPGLYLVTVESADTGLMDSGRFILSRTDAPREIPFLSPVTTPIQATPIRAPGTTGVPLASSAPAPLPGMIPALSVLIAALVLLRRR